MLDNRKKKYNKPEVDEFMMDGEISLVLMTWVDPNNPPDNGTPGGTATTSASTFEENPFDSTTIE